MPPKHPVFDRSSTRGQSLTNKHSQCGLFRQCYCQGVALFTRENIGNSLQYRELVLTVQNNRYCGRNGSSISFDRVFDFQDESVRDFTAPKHKRFVASGDPADRCDVLSIVRSADLQCQFVGAICSCATPRENCLDKSVDRNPNFAFHSLFFVEIIRAQVTTTGPCSRHGNQVCFCFCCCGRQVHLR